jgi:hypothetical protein
MVNAWSLHILRNRGFRQITVSGENAHGAMEREDILCEGVNSAGAQGTAAIAMARQYAPSAMDRASWNADHAGAGDTISTRVENCHKLPSGEHFFRMELESPINYNRSLNLNYLI